ncbi:MAG TPA: alcohol dehydrogenase catalytic domain-containing protein [Thermodesulfobacteriota bacterium]|nr:alcohol dehydrogenase catalytic domain-containing protein [Thermodesulfobacteriota bacterium]
MLLHQLGGPVTFKQVEEPRVGPSDAKIRVKAAGVGLTIIIMKSTPGLVTRYPRILGHEIAGEVVEVGSEVNHVKTGDRVVCHFYLTCKVCRFCRSGREPLCENWRGYVGMACDGGYAEYMCVPALNLCPLPEGIPFPEASIISDAIATPLHACREEAKVGPGDDVLVIGAGGGVGIHAVQMAKLCGGRVLAADLSREKLETAKALGADEIIDTKEKDLAREVLRLTGGKGVESVLDFVASSQTLEVGFGTLATAGRLVVLGFRPSSVFKVEPTFRVDPLIVLSKGLEIHGSRYISMAELIDAVKIVQQGKIKPIVTKIFSLEEAETAHQMILANKITGRAALSI